MHVFAVEHVRLSARLAQSAWVTVSSKSTQISALIAVLAQALARQAQSLRHNQIQKHIVKYKRTTRFIVSVRSFYVLSKHIVNLLELCLRRLLKQPKLLFCLRLFLLICKRKVNCLILLFFLCVFCKSALSPILP